MLDDSTASGDFDEIEAAVLETARGRWFLREFARRNRSADTSLVLDAIGRLESAIATPTASPEPKPAPPSPHALRVSNLGDVVERLQEAAWSLRSSGARPSLCDEIERWTDEIVRLGRRQHVLADALATSDAETSRLRPQRPEEADQIVFVEPARDHTRPEPPAGQARLHPPHAEVLGGAEPRTTLGPHGPFEGLPRDPAPQTATARAPPSAAADGASQAGPRSQPNGSSVEAPLRSAPPDEEVRADPTPPPPGSGIETGGHTADRPKTAPRPEPKPRPTTFAEIDRLSFREKLRLFT